jgi:CheY-like chemotaxis protein
MGMPESTVRRKILIVEDDADDMEYAGGILRPHYEIDFAADAQEARGKLIGWPPELLLCDLYMPGERGMDLAETILTTRRHEIAVVMVTGANDPELVEKALDMGVHGYLVKPFTGDELLTTIGEALRRRDREVADSRKRAESHSTRNR